MDTSTVQRSQSAEKADRTGLPSSRQLADLPGPRGLPVLGNAYQVKSTEFHLALERWVREFGPFYKFRLGPLQTLVISDSTLITHLLRERPDAFRRSTRAATLIEELISSGVFTAEGDDWRRQRKLVMRALTPEVIRNFFPTLSAMTERLRHRWHDAVAADRPVDMLRDLKAHALDVAIGLAMGQDINALEDSENPLQRDIETVFNRLARRLTTPFPYWRYLRAPVDRAADASSARIKQAVTGFIAQTRKQLKEQPELHDKPSNMLEALIVARDEPGSEFTDEHVIGNAITMVFAGEDTTSNSIAWLLNFVARHPRVADRLATEADATLGGDRVVKNFGALKQLTYIDAATSESMRLKPVAPFIDMEPNQDMMIGDVFVPKGTPILAALRHPGMQAADFPEPDEFRPERWLADPRAPTSNDPARKLLPFGGGPRFCPGRYLAITEIQTVVSMIARNFSLAVPADAQPVREIFSFTTIPSGLPIRLTLRQKI